MISEPADHAVDAVLAYEGGYVDHLLSALNAEAEKAAVIPDPPKNARAYQCGTDGCSRPAYAGGLCNAHYIRSRNGSDMSKPIRSMPRHACSECGAAIGSKGGWGLCSRHFKVKRVRVIKQALIQAMGGRCRDCGGSFHHAAFDFHHVGAKDANPSHLIANNSIKAISDEIAKCELLCANCHRIEHAK